MRDIVRQIVNVLVTIAVIVVNGLANALPLNGLTTGEISDRFDVFFVPAGYVFAIWGVIYLGLIAFSIYQALPSQRQNPRLRRIGYWYALSGIANITWLFLWHYEVFNWTLAAMLVLLLSLIVIYVRLGIGRSKASPAETWLVRVPFSIYLGWVTVATIANVTQFLYYRGWDGWGLWPAMWAVIMLVVAALVATAVSITRGDVAYVLVIAWAFAGIAIKHPGAPLVSWTAWALTVWVLLTLIVGVPLRLDRQARSEPRDSEVGVRDRW